MSHFTALVITPYTDLDSPVKVANFVTKAMEPYNETIRVEEYERPCYCVGRNVLQAVREAVTKEFGTSDEIREKFRKEHSALFPPSEKLDAMTTEEINQLVADQNKAWHTFYCKIAKFEKNFRDAHISEEIPLVECEDCKGTGVVKTTYNPKSKYDYYSVGGRWSGNIHPNGTDVFKVKEMTGITFAVLTSDGTWHERGKGGWFGMVYDEDENWDDGYKNLIAPYGEHYAILLDCHI